MSTLTRFAWLGLVAMLVSEFAAANATITGTATYRERLLLPPAAVFEATLENVSRADATAMVLGRARIESPGASPIRFSIDYDPAAVDARHRYVVRARITMDGKLMFTTDTAYPVLGPTGAMHADVLLKRVGGGGYGNASLR